MKGGPVPSILDDLCLGNVISKYFSELRVGTSKIQPELKYLNNTLVSFYEALCRVRLWEHELFSVRSITFISTLVKSPDETWIKYKAFYTRCSKECHISVLVSTSLSLTHNSLVTNHTATRENSERNITYTSVFSLNNCTMRFESCLNFWNTSLLMLASSSGLMFRACKMRSWNPGGCAV